MAIASNRLDLGLEHCDSMCRICRVSGTGIMVGRQNTEWSFMKRQEYNLHLLGVLGLRMFLQIVHISCRKL